ncbi:type VI secretion system tube protein TssD [Flavobacterium sp. ov086]|uniref:type VI secretion system tube protein TssD n=1 Tax=Flavobacterium sp. ov086 TaxID=1761785 RepID=UPI000B6BD161|nr:type VI secretion system tube protein TssD [Flavobacterium sp. ov086]SNR31428.1 hypothetical protein SAMN04487979_102270 [Flavobacterium sp. ov086]
MSFLAKLHIDGEEYNILEFNINFKQDIDTASKPTGNPRGGIIKMIIESSQNTHFLSWMLNSDLTKDGKITFYRRDAMSKMKELTFEKAFCIGYDELFTSTTEIPMKITMELVAKEFVFDDAKFYNNWIELD